MNAFRALARPGSRAAAGAVTLLIAAGLAAGCGSPVEDEGAGETAAASDCTPDQLDLYADDTLTIGTDSPAYEPWFSDDDPTNGKGYESAVAYAIADELGFGKDQVTWTTVPFNTSYQPGEKAFDFDINQISITKARAKVVTFSEPYYKAAQAVVVMSDGPFADATSFADLKEAQLGAQVGTTSLEAADQIGASAEPRVYDDTNQATKALQNGQIDALVADLPSAYYITAAVLDGSTIAGQFQPETGEQEEFGLLLAKGNPLVTCLNTAITTLTDDGTLDDLQQKWLSQTTDVPELS